MQGICRHCQRGWLRGAINYTAPSHNEGWTTRPTFHIEHRCCLEPRSIVPFLYAFSPSLPMDGDADRVGVMLARAIGGVWLVSLEFVGYFTRQLDIAKRFLFALAGFMLMLSMGIASRGFGAPSRGSVWVLFW